MSVPRVLDLKSVCWMPLNSLYKALPTDGQARDPSTVLPRFTQPPAYTSECQGNTSGETKTWHPPPPCPGSLPE